MRQFLRAFLLLIVVSALQPSVSAAQGSEARPTLEYQIKASLIFNFVQFVRWPGDAPPPEFRFCVLGRDRFGTALSSLNGELVEGSKVATVHLPSARLEDISTCHVLFISKGVELNIPEVLNELRDQSVLTIGEASDFLDLGGMINLQLDSGKVVFDINRTAARNARLDISSKLLRLARTVKE